MNWTTEEVENLTNMLFSSDERNVWLALELIKTKENADEFASALCFIEILEEKNYEIVEAVKDILDVLVQTEPKNKWRGHLNVVHELWSYGSGKFLKALQDYETQLPVFERFLKLAPRYGYIYNDIGKRLINDFKKKSMGLEYLRKGVELNPDSFELNFDYAYNLRESKKMADTAIYHYNRCIEIGAKSFEVYHNLGRIYAFQKNMLEKGVEVFRTGLARFPGTVDTMIELAYTLEDLGQIEEAKQLLEDALALDAYSHLAQNNFAFVLWSKYGEYERARQHIDKALEIAPKEGLYWHTLAEIEWYGYQDKEKALAALYKAQEVDKKYKGAKAMIKALLAE